MVCARRVISGILLRKAMEAKGNHLKMAEIQQVPALLELGWSYRHILATPFHPQTNGKLERYQQTIKQELNQVPYELPSQLDGPSLVLSTTTTSAGTTRHWVT